MPHIRGFGAYVPRYRIERATIARQHGDHAGDGETAVPAHDEGVVSLAVTAAKRAKTHAGIESDAVDAVYAASMSDPFDERGIAPHVGTAIGTDSRTRVADFAGSARAATTALLSALDAIAADSIGNAVVVGTDLRWADPGTPAERTAGAGAGAVVLSETGNVASITDSAVNTTGFIGRFQPTGASPVPGDDRFNRSRYVEATTGAIEALDADPDSAVMPAPDDSWGERALSTLELDVPRPSTFDAIGDAGAASVLLDTALALERAAEGETLTVTSFGAGGSDALSMIRGPAGPPATTVTDDLESKEYVTYAKHREYRRRAGGAA